MHTRWTFNSFSFIAFGFVPTRFQCAIPSHVMPCSMHARSLCTQCTNTHTHTSTVATWYQVLIYSKPFVYKQNRSEHVIARHTHTKNSNKKMRGENKTVKSCDKFLNNSIEATTAVGICNRRANKKLIPEFNFTIPFIRVRIVFGQQQQQQQRMWKIVLNFDFK